MDYVKGMSILESYKHADLFQRIFGVSLRPFLDDLFLLKNEVVMDISKFDDWLVENHLTDYKDDESIEEFVRRKYGEKGVEVIKDLLGGKE